MSELGKTNASTKKEEPNYKQSGALAAEGCYYKGIYLKWDEPPDAHIPKLRWRIYCFKDDDLVEDPIPIHTRTGFLFGRDKRIADIPILHPSTSSQHAVLYFRKLSLAQKDGTMKTVVRPFIMDLRSTNGTFLNDEKLEPYQYYEIKEKDVVKFGHSTRDYVFLTEESVDKGEIDKDELEEKEKVDLDAEKKAEREREEEKKKRIERGLKQVEERISGKDEEDDKEEHSSAQPHSNPVTQPSHDKLPQKRLSSYAPSNSSRSSAYNTSRGSLDDDDEDDYDDDFEQRIQFHEKRARTE
ncbi:putative Smad nuclear-interacting protein 1 [Monocercomonoides exilis]|uniref:putative Smad nuclear-interacting protein 1 n=1 Tax=Monocercomonoides exilis TaxID=2049356 RepID=UPI00355AA275|nr:putative Smad nuclear-interacting protein 1 [Monocercomonoides exilis]